MCRSARKRDNTFCVLPLDKDCAVWCNACAGVIPLSYCAQYSTVWSCCQVCTTILLAGTGWVPPRVQWQYSIVLCVCQELLGKNFFSFCACFCLTNLSVCVMLGEQGALGPSALLRCVLVVLRGAGALVQCLYLSRFVGPPTYCVCFTEKKTPGVAFGKKIFLKRQSALSVFF